MQQQQQPQQLQQQPSLDLELGLAKSGEPTKLTNPTPESPARKSCLSECCTLCCALPPSTPAARADDVPWWERDYRCCWPGCENNDLGSSGNALCTWHVFRTQALEPCVCFLRALRGENCCTKAALGRNRCWDVVHALLLYPLTALFSFLGATLSAAMFLVSCLVLTTWIDLLMIVIWLLTCCCCCRSERWFPVGCERRAGERRYGGAENTRVYISRVAGP